MASFLLLFSTTEAMASSILVRQGSRGPAVRQVQSLLIEQGWLTGAADGICGNQTVAAIKSFQKANGLDADGVCGNGTYSVLSGGREYEPSSDESEGTVMYVNATAYSADDPGNSAYTALGTHVRHGIIAVDPDIIPLGTHVYIPGYGDAVAEDVGGAIHGHRMTWPSTRGQRRWPSAARTSRFTYEIKIQRRTQLRLRSFCVQKDCKPYVPRVNVSVGNSISMVQTLNEW